MCCKLCRGIGVWVVLASGCRLGLMVVLVLCADGSVTLGMALLTGV